MPKRKTTKKKPDFVGLIMAYEGGEMTPKQEYAFLSKYKHKLIGLQGHYGRKLKAMGLLR